ncbi:MAG: hypothetical protein Q6K92_05985, partial [Thermostichus sp. DG_1_5_bins_95]
ADHPANSLADMICFQASCRSHCFVSQLMPLGCVPAFFSFGGIQNLIIGISKSLESALNFLAQLYWDYQLARYR